MFIFIACALLWVYFLAGFLDGVSHVHWGCALKDCLESLVYFPLTYGFFFLGFRLYLSKIVTIICCLMTVYVVIILAGTVHWLLCIPAAIIAIPLGVLLSVIVWKSER